MILTYHKPIFKYLAVKKPIYHIIFTLLTRSLSECLTVSKTMK